MVGPQSDGYQPGQAPGPDRAAAYHRPQIDAFARAGADMVSALTLTSTGEAIGIVQAARATGLPVAISFTVQTDGQLPGGIPLARAITEVDDAARPDYFMVNCAHPSHIEPALAEPGGWRERIAGVRYNASAKNHAESGQATGLDDGDPRLLAAAHAQLSRCCRGCRSSVAAAAPMPATSPPYGASTTKPAEKAGHPATIHTANMSKTTPPAAGIPRRTALRRSRTARGSVHWRRMERSVSGRGAGCYLPVRSRCPHPGQ